MALSVSDRGWCVVVPHHPRGAGQARAKLAAELAPIVRPEMLSDALAVAAELVGNAIRHAAALPGGIIRVAWHLRSGPTMEVVELRVTDGGAATEPRVCTADVDAIDGRGLSIVDAIAERWGFDRDALGQSVWAEIRWPTEDRAAA